MTLYAAFASNLDPNLMADRCPYSPLRGTGWIIGWRLTFGGEELGWEGAMATVVEDPSDPANQVFVALYDVHPKDVERLDEWEWIAQDVYSKIQVRVQTLDGEQLAWMYVLNAYEGGLPSARYLGILAEAAEAAGAPDDYVADLRARPCQSSGH
ncbi:gamma-glutamylcyclotransferase [Kribbella sp. NBC_00709]|uniref:gamma-glutamylcyclotransferase n=1 Tax=Kribbella sp. NBC_00709 TaxID=2975972 RepID=UPI002E2879B9|nr:gamma-glutamylcyclotransferase [Kribbella sp. NBC_00709]